MKKNLINNQHVVDFVESVESDVFAYFNGDPSTIIAVETGGFFYAIRLYSRIREELRDVQFASYHREKNNLIPEQVRDRKLLVVDDSISTGHSYYKIRKRIEDKKEDIGYADLKFCVAIDMKGLADISPKDD